MENMNAKEVSDCISKAFIKDLEKDKLLNELEDLLIETNIPLEKEEIEIFRCLGNNEEDDKSTNHCDSTDRGDAVFVKERIKHTEC